MLFNAAIIICILVCMNGIACSLTDVHTAETADTTLCHVGECNRSVHLFAVCVCVYRVLEHGLLLCP